MADVESPLAPAPADLADQPYPGLRSFQRDEAHIFFGREGTINFMVDRLAAHRFLAVTGASGSGKSSLVRTGLLDALDRGLLAEAGSDWIIVDFRPGNQPLAALASALLAALKGQADDDQLAIVGARLAQGPSALPGLLDALGVPERANILLLVDQFEETFRFRQNDEADAFVALLLASVTQRPRRIYGVITMRSDFLGECSRFPGLAEAINESQFLAPRMNRSQLREAIEGPAAVYDGKVESALVTQLLNDIGSNPDQLPLMQHVLMLMWDEALPGDDGQIVLTVQRYRDLGGMGDGAPIRDTGTDAEGPRSQGALSAHLDRLLGDLNPTQQHLAEVLFRSLVDSEGAIGRDVRRPTQLVEIARIAGVAPAELVPVIEEFRAPGRNFLTPPRPVALTPGTMIDISHESLIRQWQTLRRWVQAELMAATEYRRIETTAELWSRKQEGVLRMPYLAVATRWRERQHPNPAWAARYGGDFDRTIRFLNKSVRRNSQRKIGGLLVLVFVFIGMAGFGITQYQRAETNASALDAARGEVQRQQQTLEERLSHSLGRMSTVTDNLANEADDYGIPVQDTLQPNVGSETPTTIPGGKVLLLHDLQAMFVAGPRPLLIDTWNDTGKGHNTTIPTAVRIPFAGEPGKFDDDTEKRLVDRLDNLTDGDRARPLVFFCLSSKCWESYNAALRAIHGGFSRVYWFRGGNLTWTAGENDWQSIDDEIKLIELRVGMHDGPVRRRWADAAALSEAVIILESNLPKNSAEPRRIAQHATDELAVLYDQLKTVPDFLEDLADSDQRRAALYEGDNEVDATLAADRDEVKVRQAMVAVDPANIVARRNNVVALYRFARYESAQKHEADSKATMDAARAASQPPSDAVLTKTYDRPNPAFWYHDVGRALYRVGLYEDANAVFETGQSIDQARLDSATDQDQAAADLWDDYALEGALERQQKKLNDAIHTYRRGVEIFEQKVHGQPDWPKTKLSLANAHQSIAETFRDAGYPVDERDELIAALTAATDAKTAGNADAASTLTEIGGSLGSLAWKFDLAGAYGYALDVSDRAIAAAPSLIWLNENRAYALMFIGRTDEARDLYLKYRGTTEPGRSKSWDDEVKDEFAALERAGHYMSMMDEIEKQLTPAPK